MSKILKLTYNSKINISEGPMGNDMLYTTVKFEIC